MLQVFQVRVFWNSSNQSLGLIKIKVKWHNLIAATTKHQLEWYLKLLVSGCAEDNLDYIAKDITTIRAYSAGECQKHCKNSTACRFWTLGKPEFGSNANSCFLKDHIKERKTNQNTTSGIGDCPGNNSFWAQNFAELYCIVKCWLIKHDTI